MKHFKVKYKDGREDEIVTADRLWNDAGSVSFLNRNQNEFDSFKWNTVRLIPLTEIKDIQEV